MSPQSYNQEKGNGATMESIDGRLYSLDVKLDALIESVKGVETRLTKLINEVLDSSKRQFDEHTQRFNDVDARFDTVHERIDLIEDKFKRQVWH